jgi:hypothetical protein
MALATTRVLDEAEYLIGMKVIIDLFILHNKSVVELHAITLRELSYPEILYSLLYEDVAKRQWQTSRTEGMEYAVQWLELRYPVATTGGLYW